MTGIFRRTVHPFVDFLWFTIVICLAVAVRHPVFSALSLLAAIFYNIVLKNQAGLKTVFFMMPFFIFLSALNPLVSHWGQTTLFFVFGKPFTKEAFCYGLNMGLTFAVMIEWFTVLGAVLTTDKFTYLFSPFFPSVSLMMVMILRLVPFMGRRGKEIFMAREGMGLKKSPSAINAVLASTLEEGVYTAKTMEDRGYGKKKRTSFLEYSFRFSDGVRLLSMVVLTAMVIYGIKAGYTRIDFYPVISLAEVFTGGVETALFASYGILCFTPAVCDLLKIER